MRFVFVNTLKICKNWVGCLNRKVFFFFFYNYIELLPLKVPIIESITIEHFGPFGLSQSNVLWLVCIKSNVSSEAIFGSIRRKMIEQWEILVFDLSHLYMAVFSQMKEGSYINMLTERLLHYWIYQKYDTEGKYQSCRYR